jgi:required for meiotic nuclear division protein 1
MTGAAAPPSHLPVHAYAIAATVAPRELDGLFPSSAERVKVSKTHVIVRYGADRWAVMHDFGALVFVDVPDDQRKSVLDSLVKLSAEARPPLVETFSVELDHAAVPKVHFDRIVLSGLDATAVELLSLVIAQSVGMEYYEDEVDELVGEIERVSRRLAEEGRFRARNRELLSFVGRGMLTRTRVVHTLALLDAPAVTWDDETLDRLYRELRVSFAIEDRYRGLDDKLRVIQDNLELLVDLTRHTRSIVLELAIIVLIAIEIVLALLGRI